ncbi:MAG: gamma-glutamylcyclotransferase [Alphaproteobacteria bacterium]|nr:gamma-glutamylcyclotransferase [Alphaproteobacteria bacterium]
MRFHYFAYGSNMLTARLRARCPSARPVGRAEVADFALAFNKRGRDDSGKATLARSTQGHPRSYGVLFEMDAAELGQLDRIEGVDKGYERKDAFAVRLLDGGGTVHARTYRATLTDDRLKPYDWYLALVIAGAREHRLDAAYVATLRRVAFATDPQPARPGRKAAIGALAAAGIADYRALLAD